MSASAYRVMGCALIVWLVIAAFMGAFFLMALLSVALGLVFGAYIEAADYEALCQDERIRRAPDAREAHRGGRW